MDIQFFNFFFLGGGGGWVDWGWGWWSTFNSLFYNPMLGGEEILAILILCWN